MDCIFQRMRNEWKYAQILKYVNSILIQIIEYWGVPKPAREWREQRADIWNAKKRTVLRFLILVFIKTLYFIKSFSRCWCGVFLVFRIQSLRISIYGLKRGLIQMLHTRHHRWYRCGNMHARIQNIQYVTWWLCVYVCLCTVETVAFTILQLEDFLKRFVTTIFYAFRLR